jgi:hypothetical protein
MKLTFRMTAEEFNLGMKLKLEKNNHSNRSLSIIVAILIIFDIIIFAFSKDISSIIFFAVLLILILLSAIFRKKATQRQFNMSPILRGEHTICTYDEGLEILNGYEKIFTPWQSIFCVTETPKYLYILPTYRKGVFVINKETYKSNELDEIIATLHSRANVEEGK